MSARRVILAGCGLVTVGGSLFSDFPNYWFDLFLIFRNI